MILKDGTEIGRHTYCTKYGSPMAQYLDALAMGGAHDRTGGDAEAPCGWFNRFGRWTLHGDDRGFVWAVKHADVATAERVIDQLEQEWAAWEDGIDDDDTIVIHRFGHQYVSGTGNGITTDVHARNCTGCADDI